MHNRIEIAYEFARAIESEDIIRIILFGSVARREDKEESDIDILIVTPSREKIDSVVDDEVFNINAKYLEVVSAHIMTEEFYNRTKDYSFLTSVREEGVLLVGDYWFISHSQRKYDAGKLLYDSGFYNESIVHFYYSMYALAKILLLEKDITTKSHEGTINMIQVHYVETGELDKRFHKGLASSGSLRNEVDYYNRDDISQNVAREKRNICSDFLLEVKRMVNIE